MILAIKIINFGQRNSAPTDWRQEHTARVARVYSAPWRSRLLPNDRHTGRGAMEAFVLLLVVCRSERRGQLVAVVGWRTGATRLQYNFELALLLMFSAWSRSCNCANISNPFGFYFTCSPQSFV